MKALDRKVKRFVEPWATAIVGMAVFLYEDGYDARVRIMRCLC